MEAPTWPLWRTCSIQLDLEQGRALPDSASAEVVFVPVGVEVAFGRSGAGGS